jgi:alkylation response protein AidB-like acyl-CoA dehydrogenase
MTKLCVLPASHWRIEDTWHVAGLEGTGSHHIAIENAIVADEDFVDLFGGKPSIPGPLYDATLQVLPVLHAAVHVGIAEAALRALVDQANTGWQQQRVTKPARETDIFKYELGRIAADLRAARALHQAQAESHWQQAIAGTLSDEALAAEAGQTAAWVTKTCNQVAEACFSLGGGAAIYQTSPLQQRMRDLLVASQHMAVQQRNYVEAGARLLGISGAAVQAS